MHYLCLCYYDVDALAGLSAEDAAAIDPACAPHDAALKATGKLLAEGSLVAPQDWFHFIPRDGKPERFDGPYLPGAQQAGAFFVIEAATALEAEQVASKHAAANFGDFLGFAVEVRACDLFAARMG